MNYKHTVTGRFVDRPNRFIAHVIVDGVPETVHVKNTGRCKELLLPDVSVVLAISDNPKRKTKYDLIAVYKNGLGWVNIDSQAPNVVVKEWLLGGASCFDNITYLKPEYTYGKSRVDFYLEQGERKTFIEVKGCTLEIDGMGYFPDAPTERGVKHLHELREAVLAGYDCYLAFVIAMPKVTEVKPNMETHPAFGEALEAAMAAGMKVIYLTCDVSEDSLTVNDYQILGA